MSASHAVLTAMETTQLMTQIAKFIAPRTRQCTGRALEETAAQGGGVHLPGQIREGHHSDRFHQPEQKQELKQVLERSKPRNEGPEQKRSTSVNRRARSQAKDSQQTVSHLALLSTPPPFPMHVKKRHNM